MSYCNHPFDRRAEFDTRALRHDRDRMAYASLRVPAVCGGQWPFGAPAQFSQPPTCSESKIKSCEKPAPRVAFIVAGQARSFLQDEAYKTYDEHLVRSFAVPHSKTFLFLKLERNSSDVQLKLEEAVSLLRPAAMRVIVERTNDGRLYSDLHRDRAEAHATIVRHPECHWRDIQPHYVLQQASVWWGTMASAWSLVEQWELSHRADVVFTRRGSHDAPSQDLSEQRGQTTRRDTRFEVVVFARPDIFYQRPFGPWCEYNLTTTWCAACSQTE